MNEFSIFGTQFTASAVIVFLGHILERWFPRAGMIPVAAKRAGYWLVAAGSAVGVHTAYTPATGTLVITGLSFVALAHASWHWVQSIALQEFIHGSTKPAKP